MLEVQKYLQKSCASLTSLDALSRLNEATGVKHSIYADTLVVLNYCQINSKKTSAIAQECRSLVLEMGTWDIVSRSFDRFFNYGEEPCPALNPTFLMAHEKVDGSLIGVFKYRRVWMYRTRSVIMPVGEINGWDKVTWGSHIEKALGNNWQAMADTFVDRTFIMELTSRENKVVTKYGAEPELKLLAIRHNDGYYSSHEALEFCVAQTDWKLFRRWTFETMTECVLAAKELRNLEEGFVMYNRHGEPVGKIKNPAYVAAHHLRGEGLNPKRIKDLIIMNEVDEYLALFPEDKAVFWPYQDAFLYLIKDVTALWLHLNKFELTQKEFAMSIQDVPYKGLLFTMRSKGVTLSQAWDSCSTNNKYQLIEAMYQRNINPKEVIDHATN